MFVASVRLIRIAVHWSAAGLPAALPAHADPLERITLPATAGCSVCACPSVALLNDGRFICVYSVLVPGPDEKFSVFATYSEDHGGTWTDPVWDGRHRECRLLVDGVSVGAVRQRHADGVPSYVRFTLGNQSDSPGRVLVDRVDVEASRQELTKDAVARNDLE